MDVYMRDSFKLLETKLYTFLSSLISSPTAANAPAAVIELLAADDALTRALETLRLHQRNHARLLELNREARLLENKVKDTVNDVLRLSEEIADARCDGEDEMGSSSGDDDVDDDDDDDDDDGNYDDSEMEIKDEAVDVAMSGMPEEAKSTSTNTLPTSKPLKPRKEIDYQLLLDFARRISRFNSGDPSKDKQQLAAVEVDPEAVKLVKEETPIPSPPPPPPSGPGSSSTPSSSATSLIEAYKGETEPSHHLPYTAKAWLDETANWVRQASKLPFPNEEKIRMGIMGHLQIAAVADGPDPESEVERMMAEVEKDIRAKYEDQREASLPIPGASPSHQGYLAEPGDGNMRFRMTDGASGISRSNPKPKAAVFDLDLFDASDEDDA
ncbi:hypothetical protein KEM54_005411 [Ascosphaera aggregata]|nr:hypothetical protein KEM54_005411 [Ascosphaera aggregata]